MKNHFIIPYSGNKRCEVDRIYKFIGDDLKDIETIIEPFCGSSALSYYLSKKHPGRFKYILNDINKMIVDLYRIMQDDEKRCDELNNKVNAVLNEFNTCSTMQSRNDFFKLNIKKMDSDMAYFIFFSKVHGIRTRMPPTFDRKTITSFDIKTYPIYNFIKNENVTIRNNDAIDIINEYCHDDKCLMFIDPPYLMQCNEFYNGRNINIYEYLYLNDINTFNCHIYLCLEDLWIIRLLFKDNIISEPYSKIYQFTKKATSHIMITK